MTDCPYLQLEMPRRRKRALRYFCTANLPKRPLREKTVKLTCNEEAQWEQCPFLKREPIEEEQKNKLQSMHAS